MERCGAGTVVLGDVAGETADDHSWNTAVLGANEVGSSCGLVGDRDLGGFKLPSSGVSPTPPIVQRL
jgi:hypothetical protein